MIIKVDHLMKSFGDNLVLKLKLRTSQTSLQ